MRPRNGSQVLPEASSGRKLNGHKSGEVRVQLTTSASGTTHLDIHPSGTARAVSAVADHRACQHIKLGLARFGTRHDGDTSMRFSGERESVQKMVVSLACSDCLSVLLYLLESGNNSFLVLLRLISDPGSISTGEQDTSKSERFTKGAYFLGKGVWGKVWS